MEDRTTIYLDGRNIEVTYKEYSAIQNAKTDDARKEAIAHAIRAYTRANMKTTTTQVRNSGYAEAVGVATWSPKDSTIVTEEISDNRSGIEILKHLVKLDTEIKMLRGKEQMGESHGAEIEVRDEEIRRVLGPRSIKEIVYMLQRHVDRNGMDSAEGFLSRALRG